jgi:predicted protein tyrosine phosphatase
VSYRVLFVCTYNQCRSPTAEHLFADWPGIETRSAGVGDEAKVPVSGELVAWSDLIVVMEEAQREVLARRFPQLLGAKRVLCLAIPDEYQYMDPTLVQLLRERVVDILPTRSAAPPGPPL